MQDVTPARMHADELEIDAALVRRLVAAQLPQWADLPLEPVPFFGTDNAMYRLGEELVVRLPRRLSDVATLQKEQRWLPVLAGRLPLAIPQVVAAGEPAEGYPCPWAVYGWLPGAPLGEARPADEGQAALDLAGFLRALQRLPGEDRP